MRKDKKQVIGDEIGDESISCFCSLNRLTTPHLRCTS